MPNDRQTIRWALVGSGGIARRTLGDLRLCTDAEVVAVCSRSTERAQAFAQAHGLPLAFGDFTQLCASDAVDALYIGTPHSTHFALASQALRAGKHVLCEKPFALSADEAQTVRAAAATVHIEEAFMVRHHPQWQRARELVRAGRIGTPRAVQVFFSYFNDDGANIRNQAGIGGGALYDIGCYAVLAGRYLFEAEPLRAVSLVDRDPAMGVDRLTSALLDFGAGRQVSFTVSTQSVPVQRVQVVGTRGRIELFSPFNATRGGQMRLALDDGGALDGSGVTIETLPAAEQYRLEVEAFSRRVRADAPPDASGLGDAVAQARVIDALWRAERSGRWESVVRD